MEPNRKRWNVQQKQLRTLLEKSADHKKAIALFLEQHAMTHAAAMAPSPHSFADEIWADITAAIIRRIPQNCGVSIAWHIWHLARIEDITMNILVAGRDQLLHQDDWRARINAPVEDTGNAMDVGEAAALSAAVDIDVLRAYRIAVGQRTREIVSQLAPDALRQKTDPARLQRIMDEGAVVPEAYGIVEYWGRRTITGLLLMPPTRHNLVHINKALQLKKRKR